VVESKKKAVQSGARLLSFGFAGTKSHPPKKNCLWKKGKTGINQQGTGGHPQKGHWGKQKECVACIGNLGPSKSEKRISKEYFLVEKLDK